MRERIFLKRSFVLQSLQLSKDNEQSHIRLSSFFLMVCICPHLAASGKVGLTECRKLSKLASWRHRLVGSCLGATGQACGCQLRSRPSSPVPRTSYLSRHRPSFMLFSLVYEIIMLYLCGRMLFRLKIRTF